MVDRPFKLKMRVVLATHQDLCTDNIGQVIRKIPQECFQKSAFKSWATLCVDFLLAGGLFAAIIVSQSWILGPVLGILLGFVLMSIFVVGHDAGHRSFSDSTRVNNFVGHISTTLVYWPFHVWRLSHDIHHRYTHNLEREIAWVPFTKEKWKRWPKRMQWIYYYTRTSLYFIGSAFFTWYFIKDGFRDRKSTHFKKEELPEVRFSLVFTTLYFLASVTAAVYFFGLYGFVCLIVLPQLGYHFWLSTFTLFHHTHAETNFMGPEEWTMAKGQLGSTIHVDYPKWVEVLGHDINWHVPHHVCVGIPHYHLRKAHNALKQAYPEIVKEVKFDADLVKDVITECQFIRSKDPVDTTWVRKRDMEIDSSQVVNVNS